MKMIIYTICLCLLFCFCKNDSNTSAKLEQNIELAQEKIIDSLDSVIKLEEEASPDSLMEMDDTHSSPKNKSVPVEEKKEFKQVIEKVITKPELEKEERPPVEEPKEYTDRIERFNDPSIPGSHKLFDDLLIKHVSTDGRVDYGGFNRNILLLEEYLGFLSNQKASAMNRNEALAFWINAYNAFTIKLILDHYPINSITELEGGKPWDKKWISIGGKTYSLNQIENDIIRPQFKEARIHFAVNCAAKSCPPIMNRAWTEANLEESLERQARQFINNSKYNSISKNRVAVSKIFEWYKEDFGNLIDYLNKYSKVEISKNAQIVFLEYDWSLNE